MCHCGSDIIQIQEPRWCCSDAPCNGLGPWGHDNGLGSGYTRGGYCTTGKVLHLSQPCNGKCNTNSEVDSTYSNERVAEPCTYTDKTKNISQCVLTGQKNDKIFNCVNRADENPFSTHDKTNSTTLDLSAILTSCTTSKGNVNFRPGILGLRCPNRYFGPDECAPLWIWCKRNLLPFFCDYGETGFLTFDQKICSNASFWQQHTCGYSHHKRCNGTNPGRCVSIYKDQECDEPLRQNY